jgi:hypothetical protein
LRNDGIRLLQIEPGQPEQSIQCTLLESFSKYWINDYIALSYTWGSVNEVRTIQCNGSLHKVTKNLFEALQALRLPNTTCRIWVDSVCINQEDIDDRTNQVKRMTQIYRDARGVFIWLGLSTTTTSVAVDLIHALNAKGPSLLEYSKGVNLIGTEVLWEMGLPTPTGDPQWIALDQFLSQSWFRRVWTIQEAAVSKQATVACGQYRMHWDLLFNACYIAYQANLKGFRDIPSQRGYNRVLRIGSYQHSLSGHNPERFTLEDLLSLERSALATDDRDKVFSLLGLASDINLQGQDTIAPDYNTTAADVYIQVACWLARKNKSLRFLGLAGALPSQGRYSLPSWVPDWSIASDIGPIDSHHMLFPYSASGGRKGEAHFKNFGRSLVLKGILFDYVLDIGTTFKGYANTDSDTLDSTWATWNAIIERYFVKPGSVNSQPMKAYSDLRRAFQATIFGDRWVDGKILAAEHYDHYPTWLEWRQDRVGLRVLHYGMDMEKKNSNFLCDKRFREFCYGRRFFITQRGFIGITIETMSKGDAVCIFEGGACRVFYVHFYTLLEMDSRRHFRSWRSGSL